MEDKILNIVCTRYKMDREAITTKHMRRQIANVVAAKQEAAYLLYKYSDLSNKAIAGLLGYPSKQITNSSVRQINKIASANKSYRAQLEAVEASLCGNDWQEVEEQEEQPTTRPVIHLTNSKGQFYSLDTGKRLLIAYKAVNISGGPASLPAKDKAAPITFTETAAAILRLIGNTYGSTADCSLSIYGEIFPLDFSSAIHRGSTYTIQTLQLLPTMPATAYYLKNSEGLYLSFDKKSALITSSAPAPVTGVPAEIDLSNPSRAIKLTDQARNIIARLAMSNGGTDAVCLLCFDNIALSLNMKRVTITQESAVVSYSMQQATLPA